MLTFIFQQKSIYLFFWSSFLISFGRLIFLISLYPLFVLKFLLSLERLNLFLNGHLYSMKIKEQTRKLAAGCSKHCFEVVDRTDEVSNIYTVRRCWRGLNLIFEEYYKDSIIPPLRSESRLNIKKVFR